jgi:hypothetical protein
VISEEEDSDNRLFWKEEECESESLIVANTLVGLIVVGMI